MGAACCALAPGGADELEDKDMDIGSAFWPGPRSRSIDEGNASMPAMTCQRDRTLDGRMNQRQAKTRVSMDRAAQKLRDARTPSEINGLQIGRR